MPFRVHTISFTRNPYLFGDMTWGLMLVMIHVYLAVCPEKLDVTKSMIFGSMQLEFYLKFHDPQRWVVEEAGRLKACSTTWD